VLGFGVAGLLIAGIKALGPGDLPRLDEVSLDETSLIFIAAVGVPVVAALALSPARRVLAGSPELDVGRVAAGYHPGARRLARTLVVAQVAMSTLLLIVGTLFARSLERLVSQDPGFEPGEVVGLELSLPPARYASSSAVAEFYSDLIEATAAVSGVELASVASTVPLGKEGDQRLAYAVEGRPTDAEEAPPMAMYRKIGPHFFALLGIDVLAGRAIGRSDREDAPGVVVVSRTFAAEAFPGEDPVGRRLEISGGNFGARSAILVRDVEIVGVVEDVRFASPAEPPEPTLYLSHRQAPFVGMHLLARLDRASGPTLDRLRAAVHSLDPTLPIEHMSTLVGLHADSLSRERFTVIALSGFAAVALLLAIVGVFSIVSSAVQRRMSEMAVRQALGARPWEVFGLVIGETVWLLLAGALVGASAAALVSGAIRGMLYEATPADVWAFAVVISGMMLVGLLAGLAPARRAFGSDLVAILRGA
jgi:putative ABC transport system permease protein